MSPHNWIRWMLLRGMLAVVLPLDYHPVKNGKLISIKMMQVDTRAEVRYQHMSNVNHLLPGIQRKFQRTMRNVLPVTTLQQMEYTAPFFLGSSRQLFRLLPDTGSADLWVPGIRCPTNECYSHIRYNETDEIVANSLLQLGDGVNSTQAGAELPYFSVEYGSGSVSGNIVCDDIFVNSSNSTSTHHCFGQVSNSHLASFYSNAQMDGVLGLSFEQLKRSPGPIFMEDFVKQTRQNYVFAFYYAPETNGTSNSRFFLGEYNEHCAAEPLFFHPVTEPVWWEVEASFSLKPPQESSDTPTAKVLWWLEEKFRLQPVYSFVKDKLDFSQRPVGKTILDSGTSMMCLPTSIVSQLNHELRAVIEANPSVTTKKLRDLLDTHISTLHINMGQKAYSLRGSDLTACIAASEEDEAVDDLTIQCTINAESAEKCCTEKSGGCHILGMPFFRTHFVVFNMNSPDGVGATIGIAPANHESPECVGLSKGVGLAQKNKAPATESRIGFQSEIKEDLIGPEHAGRQSAIVKHQPSRSDPVLRDRTRVDRHFTGLEGGLRHLRPM